MEIVVGTAGHIDHGKTALVRALTGVDTDRLPEEKLRGITIDIGFAEMTAGGRHVGFVDVPGHERFIKNMLAGASGIDVVLLVVAADDGVMPQTREHFEICRLLGVECGAVVMTKVDLCDAETLELARLEIAELVAGSFLDGSEVFAVSSVTGTGIADVIEFLAACAVPGDDVRERLVARLPIDRGFTIKGFGTVVTGTLASGEIKVGDTLDLLPAGKKVRVRGLENHGVQAQAASFGQRVAVNLAGIEHAEISRGMLLTASDALVATNAFDATIEVLADSPRPVRSRQRLRVHIGTAEVLARVQVLDVAGEIAAGTSGYVQLRLESSVACSAGERFVIRSYSPQTTIAGGVVIEPLAKRHRRGEFDELAGYLAARVEARDATKTISLMAANAVTGLTVGNIQHRTGLRNDVIDSSVRELIAAKDVVAIGPTLLCATAVKELTTVAATALEKLRSDDKLARGVSREALRSKLPRSVETHVFAHIFDLLVVRNGLKVDGDSIVFAGTADDLSPGERSAIDALLAIYGPEVVAVPSAADAVNAAASTSGVHVAIVQKLLRRLADDGKIVKVSAEIYLSSQAVAFIKSKVAEFREIDVATFKAMIGVSRKYAIPLLEYLDATRFTVRVGDKRVIVK